MMQTIFTCKIHFYTLLSTLFSDKDLTVDTGHPTDEHADPEEHDLVQYPYLLELINQMTKQVYYIL